ncbi:hypothetical protein [Rufibacter roseus]|uniref:Uncharacterized protein n=1 Tax=Rufibacter roseus TaxID=1567108 RepID=A0ABW2DTL3_9BACT|nr:hypothetical protein [Rufibacter roseus]
MNIADIITEFGAYYLNSGQNTARLLQLLHRPSTTDTVLTPFFTDDTIYRASQSKMGRVLQPFQKAWTPINDLTFVAIAIEQFKMKIDTQEYPDDLEGTWLGFLAGDGIKREEWPFIKWFVEIHLLPQAKEDYEMFEVYHGVYAAPTNGVAGPAGTSMNGLRKAINDQVTAGRIDPIVLGAVPTDPLALVDYIEAFSDQINKAYWKIPMQLCVNETIERNYYRGCDEKYGKDTNHKELGGKVKYANLTVIGLPSMDGSDKIWATPKNNVLKLGKKTQNMKAMNIQAVDRLVKLFTDWWSGVGILVPEIVFTNDVDLL